MFEKLWLYYFGKYRNIAQNIITHFPDFFNYGSFIMQVNLIHAHCPTSWNYLHPLTAFKSTHTVKTDPQKQIIIWLNTFSPSNSSILELSGVYSLHLLSFLTICQV